MNVDDVIAEKIAVARARVEAAKRRRAALAAARQRGLAHRHAQKLRNLHAQESNAGVGQPPTTVGQPPTTVGQPPTVTAVRPADADDILTEVNSEEFHAAVRTSLARLGLTYAELEDQARRRDFTSAQAQVLWVSIGGAVRPELLEENL